MVNPATGHAHAAWNRGLYYFYAEAESRAVVYLPDAVQRIAADPVDKRVWAATARSVHAFDTHGDPVQSFAVDDGLEILDLSLNDPLETLLLVLDDAGQAAHVLREYDADGDGVGDNSDPDRDGDGIPNRSDPDPDKPGVPR